MACPTQTPEWSRIFPLFWHWPAETVSSILLARCGGAARTTTTSAPSGRRAKDLRHPSDNAVISHEQTRRHDIGEADAFPPAMR